MEYAKALVAGGISGLAALAAAVTDGSVSLAEWVTVGSALLVGAAATWRVPNKPPY